METEEPPSPTEYYCKICDYRTTRIHHYNYHMKDSKTHKNRVRSFDFNKHRIMESNPETPEATIKLNLRKAKQDRKLVKEAIKIQKDRVQNRLNCYVKNIPYEFPYSNLKQELNEILLELLDKKEQEEKAEKEQQKQQSEATPT